MNTTTSAIHPSDVPTLVDVALRVVPPLWGLDGFVAVNPLGGFEDLPFEEAANKASDLFGATCYPPVTMVRGRSQRNAAGRQRHAPDPGRKPSNELTRRGTDGVAHLTDVLVAHWCATYLADSFPAMAGVEGSFQTWKTIAAHDRDLRRMAGRDVGDRIRDLPATGPATIAVLLHRLGVGEDDAVAYLEAQLTRLPGWSAVMARRAAHGHRRDVVDFVAVRLAVERILVDGGIAGFGSVDGDAAAAEVDVVDAAARQAEAELEYRDRLLSMLAGGNAASGPVGGLAGDAAPLAHVVCCIDVRSEGLRRHLEAIGPYETLGFAGFFGLPIAVRSASATTAVASCPVILDPKATIDECVVGGSLPAPEDRDLAHRSFHSAKASSTSGFVLADAAGWVLGLRSVAQSLAPGLSRRVSRGIHRLVDRSVRTRFAIDERDGHDGHGLSVEEQAQLALGALTAMGLTSGFAPLVIVCGHRSANLNNPYRSALDCGACGGHAGGPNARILAAICNRSEVRSLLVTHGLVISDDTWFVAAEHETTDDTVAFLDVDDLPAAVLDRLRVVARDVARAGDANRLERRAAFPASPLAWGTAGRSSDPAQVVPDWGLARCAAIVVGPRSLTVGHDLERRVFLHSYRPQDDPDGVVLEAVMTGPVVVAHWICSQYYFSTVDPHRLGAGSKPLHNVIGRVGVSVGAEVDVRIGLPLESVWFDGEPVHEPLRLLVVVDAPVARVESIIGRNPVLRRLFDNGWARIVVRDEGSSVEFRCRSRAGTWHPWTPESNTTTADHLDPPTITRTSGRTP